MRADRRGRRRRPRPELRTDDRLGEARYGDWTGRTIKELAKEPLWKVVQQHPSAAVFPGPEGEGLAQTQARAVAAVRAWNAAARARRPSGWPAATAT